MHKVNNFNIFKFPKQYKQVRFSLHFGIPFQEEILNMNREQMKALQFVHWKWTQDWCFTVCGQSPRPRKAKTSLVGVWIPPGLADRSGTSLLRQTTEARYVKGPVLQIILENHNIVQIC